MNTTAATIELAPLWDLFVFLVEIIVWIIATALLWFAHRDDGRALRSAYAGRWGEANFNRLGAITYLVAAGFLMILVRL